MGEKLCERLTSVVNLPSHRILIFIHQWFRLSTVQLHSTLNIITHKTTTKSICSRPSFGLASCNRCQSNTRFCAGIHIGTVKHRTEAIVCITSLHGSTSSGQTTTHLPPSRVICKALGHLTTLGTIWSMHAPPWGRYIPLCSKKTLFQTTAAVNHVVWCKQILHGVLGVNVGVPRSANMLVGELHHVVVQFFS